MLINVMIADDHAIVRSGLRSILEADKSLKLTGEATGGYEAMEMVDLAPPAVLLLDISMPDLDGISVTNNLMSRHPDLKILILTIHEDKALLREAIKSGASGYILKKAAEADLIAAIHTILKGDTYIDPALIRDLIVDQSENENLPSKPLINPLTPRETDVLKLIVSGYTNRQIGEELTISVRTVDGHRANLSGKLGLKNRVELVRYAREQGLID
ncbi:MAG: response regulator transcription factor [Chloroflexi bacterium]|nr:response regulator transcription factor [Chloroflexota bacterium]